MAQIYGNADVTIAATTSESSFDGFLQDRKPSYRWSSNFIFKEVQSFRSNVLVEQPGAQLELTAEVAPLKDVLLAFLQPRINEYEWYKDGWDTVSAWDEFDGLGTFVPDDDSEGLYLPGTQIMLVAERKAPDNIQALLIQPDRDMSKFQRVGWFIQQSHHQVDADFDDESEASAGDDNYSEDFGPLRKLFKLERLTLV
ncbi:hypothetical protein TruAng_006803 [Truncatella angustata]|nr:hypothetical protein TruAng_006803 [Truncatella angustata]